MLKKLKLDIRPAPGITIVGAGGEELTVAGQSGVFVSIFNNPPMRLYLLCVTTSMKISTSVLIISRTWDLFPSSGLNVLNPKNKKHYSSNYTAKSVEVEEIEEDSGI